MLTADEIIEAVRNKTDEGDEFDITDDHILASVNRGLVSGYNIIAQVYPDPLMKSADITLTTQGEVSIPTDVFQDRVLNVELLIGDTPYALEAINHNSIHRYDSGSTSSNPNAWAQVGRKIKLYSPASVGTTVRVWYVEKPQKVVKSQGRITRLGADYFVVDTYGGGLTSDSDELNSYFNIIDFNSGAVKWSSQVKTITGNQITHKAVATRSLVLNQTISVDQSEATEAIRQDDYICAAEGSCVPYLPIIIENYCIQHAVVDILDRLNIDSSMARATLSHFDKQLRKQWSGRTETTKLSLTTNQWKGSRGRYRSW